MPRRFLLLATLLALALPVAASAAPTAVQVRIEGRSSTIFTGPVTTDGKVVHPATGGDHLCDGSNASPPVGPGPTPTTALDDAAIKGGFDWDGTWYAGFNDYAVDRVANEPFTSTEYWGVFVNGTATQVGGCQQIIAPGDEVLWAFDAFSKTAGALTLTGDGATQTGRPAAVRVTNTETKQPVEGATVGSATTGADGTALVLFDQPGVYRLKAEKDLYVRSAELSVCVDPPLVEACTSTDRTPPEIRLDTPAIASRDDRFGYMRLSWQGDDGAAGSGVRRYRLDRRRVGSQSGVWHQVAVDTTKTVAHVPAPEGSSFEFRVQAIDRAGNFSRYATATSTMPIDNLTGRIRFSREDWTTLRRQGAFKRSVSRAPAAGASAVLRFEGTGATVVTRELRRGGRVRISVDGDSRVVDLRGRTRFRRKLIGSGTLAAGEHTLRIVSLGGGPVEIDAVAVQP
jgi:hypothetical protein